MDSVQKLGNTIRVLREIKGLTQKVMAGELDMSVSGYNKIERGETDVPLSRLNQIAKVLDTDISKLLSPEQSYQFVFNNNTNANGIVQNQYVCNTDDMKQLLHLMQQQIHLLQAIVEKNTKK